jgi:hypothetical protein
MEKDSPTGYGRTKSEDGAGGSSPDKAGEAFFGGVAGQSVSNGVEHDMVTNDMQHAESRQLIIRRFRGARASYQRPSSMLECTSTSAGSVCVGNTDAMTCLLIVDCVAFQFCDSTFQVSVQSFSDPSNPKGAEFDCTR